MLQSGELEVREVVVGDELGDGEPDLDVDGIANWRRAVSEEDARSLESGIEGEIVTPAASEWLLEQQRQERLRLEQQQNTPRLQARPQQEEFSLPTRSNSAGSGLVLEKERAKSRSPFGQLFRKKTEDVRAHKGV